MTPSAVFDFSTRAFSRRRTNVSFSFLRESTKIVLPGGRRKGEMFLTDSDHFLDLDTGGVDLFGELSDGLVGVLVGKGVHVYSHT